jgi:5-formyltetrahydrofolate cyclo-ligase
MSKTDLRKHMRSMRQAQSRHEQAYKSKQMSEHLKTHRWFTDAQRIAFYIPLENEGEIDPTHLITHALEQGKYCYFPVVSTDLNIKTLSFVRSNLSHPFFKNHYGLLEPTIDPSLAEPLCPAEKLDLILVPLVAFNRLGDRLGMGKGYYDQTYGFLKKASHPDHPHHYVGLAYAFQEEPTLTAAPWDVPLQAIVTEEGLKGC